MVDLVQENENHTYPIQLERTSLDGFSVTWCADSTTRMPSCTIGIRFNFLSTDFSHSKGVKGARLRLCAKTETTMPGTAELSFCSVKLFRDHGAERKMFNDVAQLKRAIEKRKKDFVKAESGSVNLGKRKRSRLSYTSDNVPENERKAELRRSLDAELAIMQSRFYSNRPVTNFCLTGDEKDDPDLFPIYIVDDEAQKTDKGQPNLQTVTPPSTSISASRELSHSSTEPQLESLERNDCSGSSVRYSSWTDSEGPSENTKAAHTSPATLVLPPEDTELLRVDSKSIISGNLLCLSYIRKTLLLIHIQQDVSISAFSKVTYIRMTTTLRCIWQSPL